MVRDGGRLFIFAKLSGMRLRTILPTCCTGTSCAQGSIPGGIEQGRVKVTKPFSAGINCRPSSNSGYPCFALCLIIAAKDRDRGRSASDPPAPSVPATAPPVSEGQPRRSLLTKDPMLCNSCDEDFDDLHHPHQRLHFLAAGFSAISPCGVQTAYNRFVTSWCRPDVAHQVKNLISVLGSEAAISRKVGVR